MSAIDKTIFKKILSNSKIRYLISVLIVFVFFVFLIAGYSFSYKQKKNNNIAAQYNIGPIISLSQCRSCHANIDTFKKTNLIFNHWAHFGKGISCPACHTGPAHKDGKTSIPPMETCFSCHSLKHSKQGQIAPGNCETCHTPGFNRVPLSHTLEFKSNHKNLTRLKLNNCMICHTKEQCKSCHDSNGIQSDYSKYFYDGRLQPITRPELQSLTFEKIVTLSQCRPCHTDLNASKPEGLIFDHWVHFGKGVKCSTCHQGLIHSKQQEIKRPTMQFCFSCHGLKHSSQGAVATQDCRKCHTSSFNLKPSSHNVNWVNVHKKEVKKSLFKCLTCHQKTFCQNCHSSSQFKQRAKPDQILPASKQRTRHEKAHIQKGKNCSLCHDYSTFCRKCHDVELSVPPGINQLVYDGDSPAGVHSLTWLGEHRVVLKVDESKKKVCWTCHKNKTFCQACHHNEIKNISEQIISSKEHSKKLPGKVSISKKCNNCHKAKFKLSQSTLSKKGVDALVFHKGHFKLDWFNCRECHSWNPKKTQFCNGCHIKKQFCTKCHVVPMPHPKNWKRDKENERGHSDLIAKNIVNTTACGKCHIGKKFCSNCHHKQFTAGLKGPWFSRTKPSDSQHFTAIAKSGSYAPCTRCHDAVFCATCHIKYLR